MNLFLALVAAVAVLTLFHVTVEYILPASRQQEAMAVLYRVPRRHLESARTWEARIVSASDRRHEAQSVLLAEARRSGTVVRLSERVTSHALPAGHPAAIEFLAASYPDGPPILEIMRIANSALEQAQAEATSSRTALLRAGWPSPPKDLPS